MAVEGDFTVSSGAMVGKYRDRTFHYQVVGWIKHDEYSVHEQRVRKAIFDKDIPEAETFYLKVTGGSIPKGDAEYRYIWGPVMSKDQLSKMIQNIYTYGSD